MSEIDEDHSMVKDQITIGAHVLAFDDSDALLKVRGPRFDSKLDRDATYLLVGCLGGLGRHVTNLFVDRGARDITYLSRSGDQNATVQGFLVNLKERGITARVIKGDVNSIEDVNRAVAASGRPIKGMLQAALTLKDRLFENMTLDEFNATFKSRVQGTINLHNALSESPLDFFVTWSSWTSIFGVPTQTNYLASNSFMDAFACHRRSLGLPSTSLSLSQILDVGIVSGNPDYQTSLDRNGLYGSGEDEFLDFCDTAIAQCRTLVDPNDDRCDMGLDPGIGQGHLLAGIEPKGLQELGKSVPLTEMPWYSDPRFSILRSAIEFMEEGSTGTKKPGAEANGDEDGTTMQKIHRKVAKLLYTSEGEIDVTAPIKNYGIDSMIAAELRNWLFTAYKLEVSLLTLLGPTSSIESMVGLIEGAE
ncbi:MAG: hypothetical protein Q9195_006466 [Heterodermia aff. obscurata]